MMLPTWELADTPYEPVNFNEVHVFVFSRGLFLFLHEDKPKSDSIADESPEF